MKGWMERKKGGKRDSNVKDRRRKRENNIYIRYFIKLSSHTPSKKNIKIKIELKCCSYIFFFFFTSQKKIQNQY